MRSKYQSIYLEELKNLSPSNFRLNVILGLSPLDAFIDKPYVEVFKNKVLAWKIVGLSLNWMQWEFEGYFYRSPRLLFSLKGIFVV